MTWVSGLSLGVLWLVGSVHGETNGAPAPASAASPSVSASTSANLACQDVLPSAKPQLSPWTGEIVKLAEAGIDENVMLAFVDNAGTFGLDADQIVYLSDIGVSDVTIGAMLQHDQDVITGWRQPAISSGPHTESFFGVTLVTGRDAASGSLKEIPATPAALAAIAAAEAAKAKKVSPQEHPAALEILPTTEVLPEGVSASRELAVEPKRPLYPIRQSKPVQLLPPIIYVNAPEIPPNILIVHGFPRS